MSQVPHQTTVIVAGAPQSQALPALMNFLCVPGTGQLIQGRVATALLFYLAAAVSLALCFVLVGFIVYPVVILWSIVDAARYNPQATANSGGQSAPQPASGASKALALIIGAVGLAFFLPAIVLAILLAIGVDPESLKVGTDEVESTPSGDTPAVVESDAVETAPEVVPETEVIEPAPEAVVEPAPAEAAPVVAETTPEETPVDPPVDPAFRTWTDSTGSFSIQAKFVKAAFGKVTLERMDGSQVTLEMNKLSEADREWILAKAKK